MKKTLSILLCLLLSVSLVFAFAGCGDEKKDNGIAASSVESATSGETISGDGDITAIPDVSNPTFEAPSAPTVAEDTIIGSWVGSYDMSEIMEMDCSVDMTFTFNEDDTYSIEVDEEALKDFCKQVVEATAEEMEMTVDEFTAAMDMSLDEYIESSMETMEESLAASGKYKVDGDVIYMNTTGADDFADDEFSNFVLSGDTLTITDATMTMTFTRK